MENVPKKKRGNPNWVKGKSGNPAGKKPGTRDKWRVKVEAVLGTHFEQCGTKVLDKLAEDEPVVYAKLMMEYYARLGVSAPPDPTREAHKHLHLHDHAGSTAQQFLEKVVKGERTG